MSIQAWQPFANQNEFFRKAMEPSIHKMLAQQGLLVEAFKRVVLQGDHAPSSVFTLRLQQNQFELEAQLVRKTLEQQASVYKDPTIDMIAKDYSATIDKLYTDVAGAAVDLLRRREANLHNPQVKANDLLYKASSDEALLALSRLQKMRMESLVVPLHLDANSSIRGFADLADKIWNRFAQIVLHKNHVPSEVLDLHLLHNQFELAAKQLRMTIQKSTAHPTEATQIAVRDYLHITNTLYNSVASNVGLLLVNPEATPTFKASFDLGAIVVSRLHALRLEAA